MNDITFSSLAESARSTQKGAGKSDAGDDRLKTTPSNATRLLQIANRWKWLIAASVAACFIIGLVVTLLMTPIYTAEATLEIQRENGKFLNVRGVEADTPAVDMEFYQTQYGLLMSESLAERIARNLRLQNDPEFFEMFGASEVAQELRAKSNNSAAAQRQRLRSASKILLRNMSVEPVRLSRLVRVKFESPSAQLSARVVDAWTRSFIDITLERRFEATSYARKFLEGRLDQLRQRLEESEREVVRYATQQGIVNIPMPSSGEAPASSAERPLIADSLTTINEKLNQAIADRVAAQSRLASAGGSTLEGLSNQAISSIRQRRAELAADYARMMENYEPSYPAARALQSQIQELDRSLAREEGRIRSTLQQTYQAAVARESALRDAVEKLRSGVLDLRGRTIQYNIYQREADTNRQLYDALLQRYKEIGVAGGVGVNNIAVVDQAQIPTRPSSPRLFLNLLISLAVGFALGGGLAMLLDQMDEAISDPADVERTLGVSLLGTIPKRDVYSIEKELGDPKSPLVEAYLTAQTSLGFTTDHGVPRTLVVTSSRPAEGKSTTSYALARSLGRVGRRVALVDVDMRSPSLHHFFDVENDSGVSSYLSGHAELNEIVRPSNVENVAFVSAGKIPPNAAELLSGSRIAELIQALAKQFDHVVIDAPPVMGLADTPLVASHAEGAVFVVESHSTRSTAALRSIERLRDAHIRIVGVLLTKFETKRAHLGSSYDYGYEYGLSDRTGKK